MCLLLEVLGRVVSTAFSQSESFGLGGNCGGGGAAAEVRLRVEEGSDQLRGDVEDDGVNCEDGVHEKDPLKGAFCSFR